MLKRPYGVDLFICLVFGFIVGVLVVLTIQNSSIFYGVTAVLATIASVLNIVCSYNKNDPK
ncbi:MAG: hypothetical protein ACLVA2_07130 [Clostridia bacterium]